MLKNFSAYRKIDKKRIKMIRQFVKRNWIYIILLSFILLLNVSSRFAGKEKDTAEIEPRIKSESESKVETGQPESLFVDFDEAQIRSKKIEGALKENPPLHVFYIFANLFIVFVFFLGIVIDGYFVFWKLKKRNLLQTTDDTAPILWKIGDAFKIIILAFSLTYLFFIMFGFLIGLIERITHAKLTFYESENFRMIFDTIILDIAVLCVIVGFLWVIFKSRFTALGITKKNLWKNVFYGISGYVGVIPIILVIGILVYVLLNIFKIKPPPQPIVGLFLAETDTALLFVSSIIASVFGPVIEEIFFRGVMYNAVKRKFGIFSGILITSVLFSFLHTHAMTYFLVGFIPITILGMVLAYLYEKTGSLIPSITMHVLNNVGSVIMVFLFKFFNSLAG